MRTPSVDCNLTVRYSSATVLLLSSALVQKNGNDCKIFWAKNSHALLRHGLQEKMRRFSHRECNVMDIVWWIKGDKGLRSKVKCSGAEVEGGSTASSHLAWSYKNLAYFAGKISRMRGTKLEPNSWNNDAGLQCLAVITHQFHLICRDLVGEKSMIKGHKVIQMLRLFFTPSILFTFQ